MADLPHILPSPSLPSNLPKSVKWLSGEGAGSWFVIEEEENSQHYKITRLAPEGDFECEGIFNANKKINLKMNYCLTYPSHCSKVTIIQGNDKIFFFRLVGE